MIANLTQCKELLLAAQVPCRFEEPLCRHTTFRIGGNAAVFCIPQNQAQLTAAIAACQKSGVPYYLLGKGSNTLFADEGYPGAVICLSEPLGQFEIHGETMTAGAGISLTRLCGAALEAGLGGLEFAYGIPGTLGGAVYMNAGAYGGEIKDVVTQVSYLNETGIVCRMGAEALDFGYRTSTFAKHRWCILSAELKLHGGDPDAIRARMEELLNRRKEKQPLELPSAGSTFKRPVGAYAGALIEQCGLRGYRVGDAAISEKHCGFVVNLGKARCADVIRLTEEVHDRVLQQTGFELEREIRVVR